MTTATTPIDLSDFDQFKELMEKIVVKLDNFQPISLKLLENERQAIDKQFEEQRSIQSKLNLKIWCLQFDGEEREQILEIFNLREEELLDGQTPRQAETQFLREHKLGFYKQKELEAELVNISTKRRDLKQELEKPLASLQSEIDAIKKDIKALNTSPTLRKKQDLHHSLSTLVDLVPDETYKRLLTQLDLNARAALSLIHI